MRRRAVRRRSTTLPSVNLLSPWALEAQAARRLRRRFGAGVLLMLVLVSAGWAVQHVRSVQDQQILAIEEAERAALTSRSAELAPVRTFVTAVEQRKKTVTDTMRSEVRFSRVMAELAMATPADAELTNVAVTVTPPAPPAPGSATASGDPAATPAATSTSTPAVACPGPDPFGVREVIGCLTLSGTAASRDAVSQLVVDLGYSPIFVEPFISTTTTADGAQVTFTGTVGLAPKAFTGRYDQLDTLSEGKDAR